VKRQPFLTTYVALAAAAALGAYLYFVESKRPASSEKTKEKVFKLDKAKVKELSLTPREGEAIRLVKDGGKWRMTAPTDVPADSDAVESMVGSLETTEIDEVVSDKPASLGDFGLEKPRLTLAVQQEGVKEPLTLQLGDKAPANGGLYAKQPSQPRVFTVASWLESSFDKKPFDLRDRAVLHVNRDDVRSLDITGPDGSYAVVKKDKDEWAFSKPLATRAGRWSVDGLVGTLTGLRMDAVAAEEPKELKTYGLDKPARKVVVGLADGTNRTLEVGGAAPDKKYYVRESSRPMVAIIPAALVDDLAKGMAELRAKRLLEVATYEVEGFETEGEGGKRVYARSSSKDKDGVETFKWKRTAPDAKDVDTNKIQDVLFKVGGVEVQEFVDAPKAPAGYGLEPPTLRVTLRFAGGKPAAWFELGAKDGVHYARRIDDSAVLKIDAAKADELLKAFKEL